MLEGPLERQGRSAPMRTGYLLLEQGIDAVGPDEQREDPIPERCLVQGAELQLPESWLPFVVSR